MYLYLILIFLSIFFLISILPLRFSFRYVKRGSDEDATMTFWVLHGLEYQVRIPAVKVDTAHEGAGIEIWREDEGADELLKRDVSRVNLDELLRSYRHLTQLLEKYRTATMVLFLFLHGTWPDQTLLEETGRLLLELVIGALKMSGSRCERFEWRSHLGTGDAALTAIGVGVLWNVKIFLLSKIKDDVEFTGSPPHIEVHPDFREARFDTSLDCIFQLRIGHIILAGLMNVLKGLVRKSIETLRDAFGRFRRILRGVR